MTKQKEHKLETDSKPRASAPNVRVKNRHQKDERREIIKQYAPEAVDKQELVDHGFGNKKATGKHLNKQHAFFGDRHIPIDNYEADGYTAVLNKSGEVVTHRGDPLLTLPQEEYEENRRESEEMSASAVQDNMLGKDDGAMSVGLKRDFE